MNPASASHIPFRETAEAAALRLTLPVGSRCNVQCSFCSRDFDCRNAAPDGQSSLALTPEQALCYAKRAFSEHSYKFVAFAGPGDSLANLDEIEKTIGYLRTLEPTLGLLVATNGVALAPNLDRLIGLGLVHAVVAIHAVDPQVGERLYANARPGRRLLGAKEAFAAIHPLQMEAVEALVAKKVPFTIATMVIPDVNQGHIPTLVETLAAKGARDFTLIPFSPVKRTALDGLSPASPASVATLAADLGVRFPNALFSVRDECSVPLGAAPASETLQTALAECAAGLGVKPEVRADYSDKPHAAVTTSDGERVDEHLGQCKRLVVYKLSHDNRIVPVGTRALPEPGSDGRWERVAELLKDCRVLATAGIGGNPRKALEAAGVEIIETEQTVVEALVDYFVQDHTPQKKPKKL